MACLFSKETAFGRMRGYRICTRWQETGVLRCPEGKCRLYKPSPHDTLLERRIEARLGDFFAGAAAQTPDRRDEEPTMPSSATIDWVNAVQAGNRQATLPIF